MKIILDIHTWEFNQTGEQNGYTYDQLRIKESKGKKLYLTGIKNGMRMVTVSKIMKFEEGKIFISFGKNKIEIGTYKEVA